MEIKEAVVYPPNSGPQLFRVGEEGVKKIETSWNQGHSSLTITNIEDRRKFFYNIAFYVKE